MKEKLKLRSKIVHLTQLLEVKDERIKYLNEVIKLLTNETN